MEGDVKTKDNLTIKKTTSKHHSAEAFIFKFDVDESGDETDYDPYSHRIPISPNSYLATSLLLFKSSLGIGMFMMPRAYSYTGIWLGLSLTLFLGLILTHCVHLILSCQYKICKKIRYPFLTYASTIRKAVKEGPKCFHCLARFLSRTVWFFVLFHQQGICMCYTLFTGKNLQMLLNQHTKTNSSIQVYLLTIFVPFLMIAFIKNLSTFTPYSLLASTLTLIVYVLLMINFTADLITLDQVTSINTEEYCNIPLFYGIFLFAMESVESIIVFEFNMKKSRRFSSKFGVLNVTTFFLLIIYASIGILGYWRYHDTTENIIIYNLSSTQIKTIITEINCVTVFISYGLQSYFPIQLIWDYYFMKKTNFRKHYIIWLNVIIVVIVTVSFTMAGCFPYLTPTISFYGAFCVTPLGIMYPAFMDICLRYQTGYGRFKFVLFKDIFLILFGFVSGTFSIVMTLLNFIQRHQEGV